MTQATAGPSAIESDVPSRTIQSLWIGERLSRIEILSIRSFLGHGRHFHLYVYSDVAGIPGGVAVNCNAAAWRPPAVRY